jgi:hypothetical protein
VIYDLRFMIYGISESRPRFVPSRTAINYFQPPRSQTKTRRTRRFFNHGDRKGQNEGLKGFYFAIAAGSVLRTAIVLATESTFFP